MPPVPTVSAAQVPEDAVLVDVREPDEWAAGHAPGAVHVPLSELPARLSEVPDDRPVVVVCRVGGRSAQAVAWLNAQGWDTANLDGGMYAWVAAGRPLVADTGEPQVL